MSVFHVPENIKIMFLVFLFIKLCVLIINTVKSVLKEYGYCRKVMKKHLNKNLVMNVKENKKFEMTNIC